MVLNADGAPGGRVFLQGHVRKLVFEMKEIYVEGEEMVIDILGE